jgi:hypothetical protein
MSFVLSMKIVRLLLAFSVSIWMAGGCFFGCSNNAVGAELAEADSAQTAVAGESCHSATSHCCSSKKPKQQIARKAKQPRGLTSVAPTPRGMMKDCPLVVNATAVMSKSSGNLPDPGRVAVPILPLIESTAEHSNTSLVAHVIPNRGPTYLRCCVFLI